MGLASFFLSILYHNTSFTVGNASRAASGRQPVPVSGSCSGSFQLPPNAKSAPIRVGSQSPNVGLGGTLSGVSLCLMLYKRFACPVLLLHEVYQPPCQSVGQIIILAEARHSAVAMLTATT